MSIQHKNQTFTEVQATQKQDRTNERPSEEAGRSQNKKRAQDFKATAPAREVRACARRCLSGEDARNDECLKAAALLKTNGNGIDEQYTMVRYRLAAGVCQNIGLNALSNSI